MVVDNVEAFAPPLVISQCCLCAVVVRVLGAAVVRKREGLNVAVGNKEIDRLTLYHFSSAPLPETQIHTEGWIGEYGMDRSR